MFVDDLDRGALKLSSSAALIFVSCACRSTCVLASVVGEAVAVIGGVDGFEAGAESELDLDDPAVETGIGSGGTMCVSSAPLDLMPGGLGVWPLGEELSFVCSGVGDWTITSGECVTS